MLGRESEVPSELGEFCKLMSIEVGSISFLWRQEALKSFPCLIWLQSIHLDMGATKWVLGIINNKHV